MPTNDELRAMIERLESPADYEMTAVLLSDAALMLRSILAERDARETMHRLAAEANEVAIKQWPSNNGRSDT